MRRRFLSGLLILAGLLAWSLDASAFVIGDRVSGAVGGVAVRSTPDFSGTRVGSQPQGALGTVTGGPQTGDGFTWWQINFDSGVDGWCTEPNLVLEPTVTVPSKPGPLTVQMVSTIRLGWLANAEPDLAGYKVYRRTGSGAYGAPLTTLTASETTYTVVDLLPGQYFFVVTAYDVVGNESARSNEVTVTILP